MWKIRRNYTRWFFKYFLVFFFCCYVNIVFWCRKMPLLCMRATERSSLQIFEIIKLSNLLLGISILILLSLHTWTNGIADENREMTHTDLYDLISSHKWQCRWIKVHWYELDFCFKLASAQNFLIKILTLFFSSDLWFNKFQMFFL